jgi:hypothetical protein
VLWLVRGLDRNALRSRERRFESCRGHQFKLLNSNTQPGKFSSRTHPTELRLYERATKIAAPNSRGRPPLTQITARGKQR